MSGELLAKRTVEAKPLLASSKICRSSFSFSKTVVTTREYKKDSYQAFPCINQLVLLRQRWHFSLQ